VLIRQETYSRTFPLVVNQFLKSRHWAGFEPENLTIVLIFLLAEKFKFTIIKLERKCAKELNQN
jgi:hypothetical protein